MGSFILSSRNSSPSNGSLGIPRAKERKKKDERVKLEGGGGTRKFAQREERKILFANEISSAGEGKKGRVKMNNGDRETVRVRKKERGNRFLA